MKDEIESQVIESSDIGSVEEVLDLSETVEPSESVLESEVEIVADEIEMGKVLAELKPKFLSLYKLMQSHSNIVDHSSGSKRHHFKVKKKSGGKKGVGLLFYNKTPTLVLNYVDEGSKKQRQEHYKITAKGPVDADGQTITNKEITRAVKVFKKARGLA